MSRKPESISTGKKMNKAAHEERKAARNARRLVRAYERFARDNQAEVCYVNINGMVMPIKVAY